jgi:hypothetical protein
MLSRITHSFEFTITKYQSRTSLSDTNYFERVPAKQPDLIDQIERAPCNFVSLRREEKKNLSK